MLSAQEALDRLRDGNRRFVSGTTARSTGISAADAPHPDEGQRPFAAILGCSDSRVPAEIVFDQGFGDLFVIRVAGNIVAPSQIGSVEFTASNFGTSLVVVMGHTQCGALSATLDYIRAPEPGVSDNLLAIINRVRPSITPLLEEEPLRDDASLLDQAGRANVMASIRDLRDDSKILQQLADTRGLKIVGAEYSLATGVVDFFEVD